MVVGNRNSEGLKRLKRKEGTALFLIGVCGLFKTFLGGKVT